MIGESIPEEAERELVFDRLRSTGHHVVDITQDQVEGFCGNVLELSGGFGERLLVMSSQAHAAFGEEGRAELVEHGNVRLLHSDVRTIERYGGGSVRCAIAELF